MTILLDLIVSLTLVSVSVKLFVEMVKEMFRVLVSSVCPIVALALKAPNTVMVARAREQVRVFNFFIVCQ